MEGWAYYFSGGCGTGMRVPRSSLRFCTVVTHLSFPLICGGTVRCLYWREHSTRMHLEGPASSGNTELGSLDPGTLLTLRASHQHPEANPQEHPGGKMMKTERRKLNFFDLQISCCTVLKTDQNQCVSFMPLHDPWRHPIWRDAWKLFCASYSCISR